MQNSFAGTVGSHLSFIFGFVSFKRLIAASNEEIEAQRRRKGNGPQGRAEAPVRPGGGGFSGGGGWQPSSGGSSSGGSGLKLPLWAIVLIVIVALIFGGKGFLGDLFSGSNDTTSYSEDTPSDTSYATPESNSQALPQTSFTPQAYDQSGTWTVMLYQDADDQVLEQDIFTDFNEAELVGSSDQVHIVSQLDRYRGAYSGDGNWTSTRRYYVTQDNDLNTIHSQMVSDLGEANMSDPATLVDFVKWAAQTFPADHYVLILSDHGMGWPGGWVDGAPSSNPTEAAPLAEMVGNALYLDQLDGALAEIKQQTSIAKFDIIGLDACLMGQLEVLSALQPYADYAITSEETEPSLGWAYTAFLKALSENPGMSAGDLSRLVVQSYINDDERIVDDQARAEYLDETGSGYASAKQLAQEIGQDSTLSAIDLSQVPALMNTVNDLSFALQNVNQSNVAAARSYALSFTSIFGKSVPPSFIDLGNFVQVLAQQNSNSQVQQLSSQVLAEIKQAVIAEKHGSSKNGATGVSIYFPNSKLYGSQYSGPESYTVIASRFAQASLWDDFLAFHYTDQSFEADTRVAAVPTSGSRTRAPGAGSITVSPLRLSADTAAPGQPVTLRADITGNNIGNIYLFVGYYDQSSNSIFVADTDFLESPNTQQVDGVSYPKWGENGKFTVKFNWDPTVFTISDGTTSAVALFTPQQYGATAADAIYSVDGIYTFSDSGNQLNARLNFRDGRLVSVYGITGQGDTGAPSEITPQSGDTFTIVEKWLDLDTDGNVSNTEYLQGQTVLTFNGTPFTWQETYAAQGDYVIGFVVTDLDGNSQEVYQPITVQ